MSNDPWKVLAGLVPQGWDTVVHLGAGDGRGADARLALPRRQLVLVEGAPPTAALLKARMRRVRDTRVIECAAAPSDGHASWHRHSVRHFDGLVRQDAVARSEFPRLRWLGESPVPVLALETVLRHALDDAGRGANHALVVDIALTDQSWLTPAAAATLARFRVVLVVPQGGRTEDACPPVALREALAAAGFATRLPGVPGQPAVFELDPQAWEWRQQQAQALSLLAELQTSVSLLRTARQEAQTELAGARERVSALESEVRRLRGLWTDNERQHKELRLALARADGALRALGGVLRTGSSDAR